MSLLITPNLPQSNITTAFVSSEINQQSLFSLCERGVDVIPIPKNDILYNAVCSHADMQMFYAGNNTVYCEDTIEDIISENLSSSNICSGKRIAGKYPGDIAYNAAMVGEYLICNKPYTAKEIISDAINRGIEIIPVRQGYAKCNICIIAENAIITSDEGIARTLQKYPIDVLLVDDSSVRLKNFNHGFLGGASGKIAPDKLAVNGNIKLHSFCDEIVDFARRYSVEVISLNEYPIEDIGSIIPICENITSNSYKE